MRFAGAVILASVGGADAVSLQRALSHEGAGAGASVAGASAPLQHVRAERRTEEATQREASSTISAEQCSQVLTVLRSEPKARLTAELWDIACSNRYSCSAAKRLPAMPSGCLAVSSTKALNSMLDMIGRPNPCSFNDMFTNSLFVSQGCPMTESSSSYRISRGGVTYSTCGNGFATHGEGCAAGVQLGSANEGLSVFMYDAVMGLPVPWEAALLRPSLPDKVSPMTEERRRAPGDAEVTVDFYPCSVPMERDDLQSKLAEQVRVMQDAHMGKLTCESQVYKPDFASTGIRFKDFDAKTDFHEISDDRCDGCDTHYIDLWDQYMSKENHKLKILVCQSNSLLGVSAFPWAENEARGTMIDYRTLPGNGMFKYDMGKTAVHETAHYMGLWHVFQQGCDGGGDHIDDTDPEESPFFGCPTAGPRSCEALSNELDPVHNLLDYADDRCMCSFSPGQVAKLQPP